LRHTHARSRHVYISPLLQFARETSQGGWDDVPSRPLLSRSDLPKVPSRLPRFIPRQELDRLMKAIEELQDPDPYIPGSYDDVVAAYDLGHLTDAQYAVLVDAIAAAQRTEDAADQ